MKIVQRVLKTKGYGWKPQLPDQRDLMYKPAAEKAAAALPAKTDLTAGFGPVVDQGQLGSCTANAGAGMFGFMLKKQGFPYFDPARLFIYYNERMVEGTVNQDSGAAVRDCLKVLATYGVCPETMLPYDITKFKVKPSKADYTAALNDLAISYLAVSNAGAAGLTACKTSLANGYPVIIGFSVYDSFEGPNVAKTGIMPMPAKTEKLLGGHCVLMAGYDDTKQAFLCRNSWGADWGIKGYFWMPYAYASSTKLASDFWTLREVVK